MQRFVDAWMAFPGRLLLLTIVSLVGRGVPQIIVVLGVTGGIGGSRVVRGAVVGVKENLYLQAAEATGSTRWRTLIRHVLPNIGDAVRDLLDPRLRGGAGRLGADRGASV